MATAYWYTGNADTAIAEFQKSLSYDPNKANTLFNLGIVEWQGKIEKWPAAGRQRRRSSGWGTRLHIGRRPMMQSSPGKARRSLRS